MNNLLTRCADLAGTQLWQATAVGLIIVVLVRYLGKRRPHLAFALLLLAICKFVTPPIWSSPIGLFSSEWYARDVLSKLPPGSILPPTEPPSTVPSPTIAHSQPADLVVIPQDRSPFTELLFLGKHDRSLSNFLLCLWLCGAAMVTVFLGGKWRQHRKAIKESSWLAGKELQATSDRIARSFGIERHVQLLITSRTDGPFCYGIIAPCIVLPQQLVRCTSQRGIELILTHELCHIWRYDALTSLLQLLAGVLWWFHPLMWSVNRHLTRYGEQCCDLEVLRRSKCAPDEYAQAVLDVLKLSRATKPPFFSAGIRPADVTKARLELIMSVKPKASNPWRQWIVWAFGMMLIGPGAVSQTTIQSQLLAAERTPLDDQQKLYADSKNLTQAIDVLKKYLDEQGLSEYKHLFSEESVSAGIENTLTAVMTRSQIQLQESQNLEMKSKVNGKIAFLTKTIEPLGRQVAEGKWLENAYFYVQSPNPKYSTLTVNLMVDLRDHDLGGYAVGDIVPTAYGINIITLNYGFEPRLDSEITGKTVQDPN